MTVVDPSQSSVGDVKGTRCLVALVFYWSRGLRVPLRLSYLCWSSVPLEAATRCSSSPTPSWRCSSSRRFCSSSCTRAVYARVWSGGSLPCARVVGRSMGAGQPARASRRRGARVQGVRDWRRGCEWSVGAWSMKCVVGFFVKVRLVCGGRRVKS